MSFRKPLHRRAVLRGAGGAVLGLPWLETMLPRVARAQVNSPKRFVVMFGGTSLGESHGDFVIPKELGAAWSLTRALMPLGGKPSGVMTSLPTFESVQKEVTIVSGMRIPYTEGGVMPPAGRPIAWHSTTPSPLFSGTRALAQRSAQVNGPTSDQLMADMIGKMSKFRSLEYRAQSAPYREPDNNKGRMSWRKDATGAVTPNNPIISPRVAYDQLFRGFVDPATPAGDAARMAATAREKTTMDLVRGDAQRLMARLGPIDKERLDRHFTEIQDLEKRVNAAETTTGGLCKKTSDPGQDPPVEIRSEDRSLGDKDGRANGWSNESVRAKVLIELVAMALVCDQTRVATLMLTFFQSFMSMKYITNIDIDLHDTGHHFHPPEANMADAIAWHISQFAYLISLLRAAKEGSGTVLDHSALVFLTEGGWGYDPELNSNAHSHSSENMAVLLAGRAGGMMPGRHIRAAAKHPAAVILAAMRAAGGTGPLGDIADPIMEVFG